MSDLPPPAFSRTPLFALSVALAGGLLCARYVTIDALPVLTLAVILTCVVAVAAVPLLRGNRITQASLCVISAFATTGFAIGAIERTTRAPSRLSQLYEQRILDVGDPVELTGTIDGQPERAPQGLYLRLHAHKIKFKQTERDTSGSVLLVAHLHDNQVKQAYEALELRHGAQIRVMTMLDRENTFRNPGVMRFTEYLERNDFEATGVIKSPLLVERLDDDVVFLPLAWLYDWRQKLQNEFAAKFSAETSGVLNAALLGNRYGLSHAAADRFRAGGTFHVLVISGMHISFIGGMVFLGSGWVTRKRFWRFLIAALLIWAYTLAVGADAPVARAALMFTLVIFAPVVWRKSNSLNVIGATAMALLVWRPNDLFDPSFQLTFMSVLAIVLIAVPLMQRMQRIGAWQPTMATPYPPLCSHSFRVLSEMLFWSERNWRAEMAVSNISYQLFKTPAAEKLERWRMQKLCRFMFAAILVSACVQVAMLPPMIVYFHRLSFASVLLNIFVGALMGVLGVFALAAVTVSQIGGWLATPLVFFVEKLNWLMIHAVDPFAALGLASIRLPHYSGWASAIYALYYLPLGLLVGALARWDPLKPVPAANGRGTLSSRRMARWAGVLLAVLFVVIVIHPLSASGPDGKLHVDFLDVGQGDAALLTTPDGTTLLIDGGGHPNIDWANSSDEDRDDAPFQRDTRTIGEGVVSEYLWSRGLDRVDYVLATHADADHIDGLNDVVRNFRVRGAIVARTPVKDSGFARFAESLKQERVPLDVIGGGDAMQVGGVKIDVLWPPQVADTNSTYRNNDALVLRVRYGEKVLLFNADIEKDAESALLKSGTSLRSDVIKVAHHGSRTSSIQPFVDATHPTIAVISVGRTSIFGHPHKEVLDRWRASGAQVMTTGEKGTISVVTDGRGLEVSTFVK